MAELRYRFPGEPIVEKKGGFKRRSSVELSDFKGFVISLFDNSEIYIFEEGLEESATDHPRPFILDRDGYRILAQGYIERMQRSELDKVILSRIQEEKLSVSPIELFEKLEEAFPKAFVYLIESKSIGTWIGASPEILLEAKYGTAKIMSLAGTKKANDQSEWGEKEREEQRIVTQFLRDEIRVFSPLKLEESPVFDRPAGPVKHLCSELQFELQGSPLEFITRIHPTPAVCGQPRTTALQLIQEFEPHRRLFYAGMIGVLEKDHARVYVNLRCAQIIDNHIYLYVGGGLTKDSIVNDEWNETLNKAETIRQFL